MERVVKECAAHFVSDLTTETSIETRSLPGINRNKNFVKKVDQFIADHVSIQNKNTEIFKKKFN
jgi:influenza virus NS1A-binding protein